MSDIIIHDGNYLDFINPVVNGVRLSCEFEGMFQSRDMERSALGYGDLGLPLIPESEWKDRIKERIDRKLTARDYVRQLGIPPLNQGQTNYCWAHGVVNSLRLARARELGSFVDLSPASVAARVKNFRNVGGWGDEALRHLIEHGCNEMSEWPENQISRRYDTAETRELAKRHRVKEHFYRMEDWREVVSAILHGLDVAVGYNWWRHLVLGVDLTMDIDLDIWNSWGGWGDNGFGILAGRKKYPDGAVVVVNALAA